MARKPTEFELGVLMAASVLNSLYDQPGYAATLVKELGCTGLDCADMDSFDKANLRTINTELGGLKLRGLRAACTEGGEEA